MHQLEDLSLDEMQKQNFLRDQSGMKKQLLTLQQLISVMDPELYRHFGLFIIYPFLQPQAHSVFREDRRPESILLLPVCSFTVFCTAYILKTKSSWVLIAFKREFPFDDVLRLWEVLWTDYYSNEFVLFVALAVLESHRDVILRYLVEVISFFHCPPYRLTSCFVK